MTTTPRDEVPEITGDVPTTPHCHWASRVAPRVPERQCPTCGGDITTPIARRAPEARDTIRDTPGTQSPIPGAGGEHAPTCARCSRTVGMLPGGRALPYVTDTDTGRRYCADKGACRAIAGKPRHLHLVRQPELDRR